METKEVENELEELETRVERLRALYEQYFMGIEKLEPQIPRKDVDRRIWVMRREQIRNTGLRFKFQMLVQRYNTFQQYWGRITREIENGTYRRDVLRAANRFGGKEALTIVGKKRAERYANLVEKQAAERGAAKETRPDARAEAEEIDVEVEVEAPRHSTRPPPAAPAPPPRQERSAEEAKRRVAALAAEMKAKRAAVAPSPAVESGPLDLDLDLDGPVSRKSNPPARRKSTMPPRRKSSGQMKAVRIPPPPALPNDAPPPPAAAPAPPAAQPGPPRRRSSGSMKAVTPPAARPQPPAAAPPPQAPAARPVPPVPARPAPPMPRPAAPNAPATPDELPEQRLRQIYSKYVETKRAGNESTAGITYEKLAESLRAQAEKLRATHTTKKVDYEVIVKDGKTVLKPILR